MSEDLSVRGVKKAAYWEASATCWMATTGFKMPLSTTRKYKFRGGDDGWHDVNNND